MELGNKLGAGYVPINEFQNVLRPHLPSLRHIQINTVQVVDHLGQTLPVPIMFCSAWKVVSILSLVEQLTYDHILGIQLHN
jgi:hypothetical protein